MPRALLEVQRRSTSLEYQLEAFADRLGARLEARRQAGFGTIGATRQGSGPSIVCRSSSLVAVAQSVRALDCGSRGCGVNWRQAPLASQSCSCLCGLWLV